MLNHNINTNIVPFVGEEQSISYINRLYIVIASWETCMQVRTQQLELDMEQRTGSK